MKKLYAFIIGISLFTITKAQNNVGIGTNTPNNYAKLDISATDKGLLIPRMTTALRNALTASLGNTEQGLIVFDTDLQKFFYWDKNIGFTGNWNQVVEGSLSDGKIWIGNASNVASQQTMSGDATITNTGILDLSNNAVETSEINNNAVTGTKIDIAGNSNGSIMYYDGTDWINLGPGTSGQILRTNGAGAPSWVSVGTVLDAQNGLNVNTNAPNASATRPYVELGGALVRNTTISQGTFNYIQEVGTGNYRVNATNNTTSGSATTYPFGISRGGFTDFTIGSDATNVYQQSWNSKPLLINSQGNNTLINLNTGYVGIGVTIPAQKLDVQGGNARINNAFIGDVGHGSGWAAFSHSSQANSTGYTILASNDGNYTLINKQNTGTGYIGFRMSNNDVAVINGAGNMGIGTTAPLANARLQVVGGAIMPQVGNSSSSGIYFPSNPGGGSGDESYIRYYVEAGENTKLVIANVNDVEDDISIRTGNGFDRLNINGNGTINMSRSVLFDCNDCGSTVAYDLADGTGGNFGDLVIQGRVLSANANIHLSPPGGSRVIINSVYRGAGGGTGNTGLDIEDGGIRMRKNYMYFQRYAYTASAVGVDNAFNFSLGNWDFCSLAHYGMKNNASSTDEDDDAQCAVYPNGAGAGEQTFYDHFITEQYNSKRSWFMYMEAFEDTNGITCAASCINFE